MRWMRVGGVVAAVAIVVSGCAGGSSGQAVRTIGLSQVAKASQATTARVEIVQHVRGRGSDTLTGELDLRHRRVHLQAADGSTLAGKVAGPDLASVPAELRAQMAQTLALVSSAKQLIVIGDDRAYFEAKGRWWDLGKGSSAGASSLDVLSPTTLLTQLAKLGTVRSVGTEPVRGVAATRYATTDRATGDRYEVWVDGSNRAVRVTVTAGDPRSGQVDRATMELYDFGVPVSIEAPAGAEPLGTGSAVHVGLHQVATGTEGRVAWTLSTGAMADGRRCVRVQTTPKLDGEVVVYAKDGRSSTSSDVAPGDATDPSCGPAPSPDGELGASGAVLLAVGGHDADVHYLTGLLGPGAKVLVRFHDGHTEQLEGHDGAFVLFFSGDDWPTRMSGGNTSCDLQGDRTTSGTDEVC